MHTIQWRKWTLKDFCILVHSQASIKTVLNEELNCLFEDLILENQGKQLIETDSTLLPGFQLLELLEFKNKEDIKKSCNSVLKRMLNKIEENKLILPAPLCWLRPPSNELVLIDGNHRSAFAKIMNIPIKVQVLNATPTLFGLKNAVTKYKKVKYFIDSIKKESNI